MNATIKKKTNFTEGPIFKKMIVYTIPIILTSLLQICYGMADNIVVGRYSGEEFALAAVGATGPLSGLIVNLLLGIGGGGGIVIAHAFGAKDYDKLDRAVHTSVTFSLLGGIVFGLFFYFISEPALVLMKINPVFIDLSIKYLKIYAFGIPASAVYNYIASIIRNLGDSRTPLIILSTSGIINILLNLFFVIVFGMDVDGVALATIISQYVSAVWVSVVLIKRKNVPYSFSFKKLGIDWKILRQAMRYGIPSGIQASMFNISNMLIVSSMNTFDAYTYMGYTINTNIDNILYCLNAGFSTACLTFTAQNYGAKNLKRIDKVLRYSILQTAVTVFACGMILIPLTNPIAMIFMPENAIGNLDLVLKTTRELNTLLQSTYFILGILTVLSSALRGIGYSILQMILYTLGLCGTRIIWIYTAFPHIHTPVGLMLCYPISWTVCLILLGVSMIVAHKKLKIKFASDVPEGED